MRSIFLSTALLIALCSNAQFRQYPQQVWTTMDKIIGNAKVVAFGESSHRVENQHKFANDMFKYLVEKKGFRVFVFETMWELENAFNDWVKSDSVEMDFKQSFYLNAFRSGFTMDMLKWAKQWNRSKPNDPIIISGYQPEQPVSDARDIKKILSQSGVAIPDSTLSILNNFSFYNGTFKHDLDAVSYFGKKRRAKQPLLRSTERDSLRKALNGLMDFVKKEQSSVTAKAGADNYKELMAHIISVKGYYFGLGYYADATNFPDGCGDAVKNADAMTRNIYSEGDKARSEIFNLLREARYRNRKIFIWMHAWHAAKFSPLMGETEYADFPVPGTVSWGTYMNPQLKKDYVVIAGISPSFNGPYSVGTGEVDLTAAFFTLFKEKQVMVNLRSPDPAHAKLPLHRNGSLFVQEGHGLLKNVNLSLQFDGVIYLPSSKDVR